MVLAVLLVIGGVEQNLGPVVEVENIIQLVCTGCNRILRSGIQCELCGCWYYYSCGNVKAQMAVRSVRLTGLESYRICKTRYDKLMN
jgi:hypothetical protein